MDLKVNGCNEERTQKNGGNHENVIRNRNGNLDVGQPGFGRRYDHNLL
jgi:hypothetical protein